MRRGLGFLLVGLGVFLLVLAPLLRFYALPALAKAPLDQDSQTVSVAPGATYLNIGKLELVEGATLTATRRVQGDVAAGNDDRAVWDIFVRVENEGALVTATTDRVAFDRSTSEALNCCGESLNGAPAKHKGIEYKFPFNAEKKTYQYFDTTLGAASDMVYKASEKIAGVSVYRYEQVIEPTKIAELEVPGTLIGRTESTAVPVDRFYSNLRRVWVEPSTGVIVKGQEEQLSTLRDDSGEDVLTVTEATLTFSDETVAEQAKTAKDNARSLNILRTIGPAVLGLLGLVLVLLGLGLALRNKDDGEFDEPGRRRRAPVAV